MSTEQLLLSQVSALLSLCREHEVRIGRLETALETTLGSPNLAGKALAREVVADLHEYDALGDPSSVIQAIDHAIATIQKHKS